MDLVERFRRIKPERRRTLIRWFAFDSVALIVAYVAAMCVSTRSMDFFGTHAFAIVVGFGLLAITTLLLTFSGIYAIQIRYISMRDVFAIGVTGLLSASLLLAAEYGIGIGPNQDPLLAPTLFWLVLMCALIGTRIARRSAARSDMRVHLGEHFPGPRTLLVGAGDAGELIVKDLLRSDRPTHELLGLIDDDPLKSSTQLHGIHVLGATEDLPVLVEHLRIEEILIAIPSADGPRMRQIVEIASGTGVRVRTLPAMSDIITGRAVMPQLREVEIGDLLRRKPMEIDGMLEQNYVSGEVVLITGGGGSIGSELARQISLLSPAQLILVGKGENSLFEIEHKLILQGKVPPVSIVGDVRDRASMEAVFAKYAPTIVFHAAAHKHVPLMQANPIEAILNNVWGTYQVADLAVKYGAKKFILVSTDKAVRPSNVMGATKRVAELLVGAFAQRTETDFAVVRFGNVLGSRGSLIPAIKMQIQHGGPVRITHPDMTRFFMTIPEAAQLIVQAGAMGKSGEIFILDMGEPVKIVDVARSLIKLHGYDPETTMPIVFIGARPGEKLHEELIYESETTVPTSNKHIMSLTHSNRKEQSPVVFDSMHRLVEVCRLGDQDLARQCLMEFAWQGSLPQRAVVALSTEPAAKA